MPGIPRLKPNSVKRHEDKTMIDKSENKLINDSSQMPHRRWAMKSLRFAMAISLVGAGIFMALGQTGANAQDTDVQSLRGRAALDEAGPVPELRKQSVDKKFSRAYRQQPPLIPHRIEKYQINLKVNQCLRCHDWPYSNEEGATKVSETHYFNRNGVALDRVSPTRWFCTQCHVPQAQARALVRNKFKSAVDAD